VLRTTYSTVSNNIANIMNTKPNTGCCTKLASRRRRKDISLLRQVLRAPCLLEIVQIKFLIKVLPTPTYQRFVWRDCSPHNVPKGKESSHHYQHMHAEAQLFPIGNKPPFRRVDSPYFGLDNVCYHLVILGLLKLSFKIL
jgi:hypothetical protein